MHIKAKGERERERERKFEVDSSQIDHLFCFQFNQNFII